MTVMEAIEARRSVRSYSSRPVTQQELEAVLEAGRLAPSARNRQAWHFTAVRDAALRARLMAACKDQKQVGEAPVTLVVWAEDDPVMACGQSASTVDCSIALSFMLLRAAELGLGTCWLGAFDAGMVREVLGLPAGAVPVAVTPLGHPAEQPAARPRKAPEEVWDIRG